MQYDLASVDYILKTTRSVRKRLDLARPVEPEIIMECLEIALQAPTGSNAQGWKWLIVTDAEKKTQVGEYYRRSWLDYSKQRTNTAPGHIDNADQMQRVISSAAYLGDHMHEVPMMIIPCILGRTDSAAVVGQAGLYGSILPAAWSLMLALRARGIGAAWTTLHLVYEKECAELLGIPENYTQVALLPVGYFTGETFKPAERLPADQLTYWDTWGETRA